MGGFDEINAWTSNILKGSAEPPAGYAPVPGSKVGLYRKREGAGWRYWKPRPAGHDPRKPDAPVTWQETAINKRMREAANAALASAGLDGNGRFPSASAALAAAFQALGKVGVEPGEIVSLRDKDKGQITVDIAESNPDEAAAPITITDSVLSFQYTKLAEDRYEAVAYLS